MVLTTTIKEECDREIIVVETNYDEEITAIVSRSQWDDPLLREFSIGKGGSLKIIGESPKKGFYVVRYKSRDPGGKSFGTEAPNGTVFDISKERFLLMKVESRVGEYFERTEKEIIRKILTNPDRNQTVLEEVEKFEWITVKNLDPLINDTCFNCTRGIERGGRLILLGTAEYSGSYFTLVKYENPEVHSEKTAIAPNGTIFWRGKQIFEGIS